MALDPESLLKDLFKCAVKAADAEHVLEAYLPKDRTGKIYVVGAGKGSAKMAQALERHWQGEIEGLVITRYGHHVPCKKIEIIEAAHPVPDEAGLKGAERILDFARARKEGDFVIALISGGGSALLSLPAKGISMSQKQEIHKALLHSGAGIEEMNCVRKHLSAIKGGRLAKACAPARLMTLAISDVPGDEASVIASGPTVGDDTTSDMAEAICKRYGISNVPNFQESVFADDPCFENNSYHLIATPQKSLQAVADHLEGLGITHMILSDRLEGEAREMGKMHAAIVRQILDHDQPMTAPCVLISGGEATVTIKNKQGRGGPNAEFLLSFLEQTRGLDGVYALACDTDGIDGSEDNAGAWITPETFSKAQKAGLTPSDYLDRNLSYGFFKQLELLYKPGPTLTNVNDLRVIYITKNN